MSFPTAAWSALAVVSGLFLPPQSPSNSRWNELFDYTNLPPSNATFWEPLSRAQVPMEAAIEAAKQSEQGTVRTLKAELVPGPEGATWRLELFVGDEAPKRVNLTVSAAEPKVLKRLELRSVTAGEQELWTAFSKVRVPAEDCIEVAKKAAYGRLATPRINDARARTLTLTQEKGITIWTLELMGLAPKKEDAKKENVRRYGVGVDTKNPVFKYLKLLDRFAGTPLRANEPTELPNGMVLYDFRPGEGDPLAADAEVEVNYRLWLLDNTKLHDTWKRSEERV